MSGEVLRQAAALMRERAEAVKGGLPWETVECEGGNRDQRRTLGTYSLIHNGRAEVALVRGFSSEREPVAAHIAGMDPHVALAVADLLEVFAMMPSASDPTDMTVAVNLARTYLGDPA